MKVRQLFREPDMIWVNHNPFRPHINNRQEHCLVTAIAYCYPDSFEQEVIIYRVRNKVGNSITAWNDKQLNVDAILSLADELDI